jgi:phosphoglycerol transferase MdoB-like AlkP superfamily enzyme
VLIEALKALAAPLLIGLALSLVLEQVHQPRPRLPWQRSSADLMIHSGCWLLLYLLEFIQFGRPWLALYLTSTIFYVLVLINHAKFYALREPFIYQDLDYFFDAIKHPRLYLPFFGFFKIAACLTSVGVALWLGLSLEAALSQSVPTEQVKLAGFVVLVFALVLLYAGHRCEAALKFHVNDDFKHLGLVALFWRYAWAERKPATLTNLTKYSTLSSACPIGEVKKMYDTVVVQSESFFDPRRAFGMIKPSILSSFDQACRMSMLFGTLAVPAWGANTVRTEFSFLSGIDSTLLGIDQFNPYRRLVSSALPSLAHEFKKRGYRTVCIHPYPESFYQRDKIFRVLGFDEFIDLRSFTQPAQKQAKGLGPYVSDQVLTDKILETLAQQHEQPLFIFAITMENHGPLHLEHINASEERKWLNEPLPMNCKELAIYLRHLANADQMIMRLLNRFSAPNPIGRAPMQLLWYGDHVPVLAKAYEQLGLPDSDTDYFLWRSDHIGAGGGSASEPSLPRQPLRVHQLGAELLK